MDEFNVVDATQGDVVDSQTQSSEGSSENLDVATQKPVQDDRTNSAFAEMRRRAEQAERTTAKYERDLKVAQKFGKDGIYSEDDIAKSYGQSHGIYTLEQLESAIEAQSKGIDPKFYNEVQELKNRLNSYEFADSIRKQEESLEKDPILSQFKDDIKKISKERGTDINVAKYLFFEEKFPELLKSIDIKQKNEKNAATSVGSVIGKGTSSNDFISFEEFNANKNDRNWVNKNLKALDESRKKW